MSEAQFVDSLEEITGRAALEKSVEKVAELSFMRTLALAGESTVNTIVDESSRLQAIRFIAERNQYVTMAQQALQEASTAIGDKKAALQLAAISFQDSARSIESRFLQQFAQGQVEFSAGVSQVFGALGRTGDALLGPVVGGIFLQHELSEKLDDALQAGQSADDAAQIIVHSTGLALATQLAALQTGVGSFLETGSFTFSSGRVLNIASRSARFLLVVGRAAGAASALALAFEGGYRLGTLLNEQPFFSEGLADLIDGAVALLTQDSTASRYPSDVGALAFLATQIDRELSLKAFDAIIQASFPSFADRKELNAFHNALRKLLTPDLPPVNATTSDAFVSGVAATLHAVRLRYPEGQLTVTALTAAGSSDAALMKALGSEADALAYRYALRELNPFVITGPGVNYAQFNQGGELDLYDPSTRQGKLTEAWVEDRAGLLQAVLLLNTTDSTTQVVRVPARSDRVSFEYHYFSGGNEQILIADPANNIPGLRRMVEFADNAGRSLIGTPNPLGDHLYGGAGNDTLIGDAGNDYLEGSDGNDTLRGDAGTNDLVGGRGFDTYIATSGQGQGFQVVSDSDGLGQILLDGAQVTGGKKTVGNSYVSADGVHTFSFSGDLTTGGTLTIDDTVRVDNFRNNDLGIALDPILVSSPGQFTFVYIGNHERPAPSIDPFTGADVFAGGSDFNDYFQSASTVSGPNSTVIVIPGGGSAEFWGKSGDDFFEGAYNQIDGFFGGSGNDVIEGGALGADQPPQSPPDASGDYLSGDAGQDHIVGSIYPDRISGDWAQFLFMGVFAANIDAAIDETVSFSLGTFHGSGRSATASDSAYVSTVYAEPFGGDPADFRRFNSVADALNYALGITPQTNLETLYDDFIDGRAGDDQIDGGVGSDMIFGGEGSDAINGDGTDFSDRTSFSFGGLGAFGSFKALLGKPGDDYIDGGSGDDILTDSVILFVNNRVVSAGGGNDVLLGGEGNDTLNNVDSPPPGYFEEGVSFSNVLDGGDGDDQITSQNLTPGGYDLVLGGAGSDQIDVRAATADIFGGSGDDVITASRFRANIDTGIPGGEGTLNFFESDPGPFTVHGGEGNDAISATADLYGDEGNDTLSRGLLMVGGSGDDTYYVGFSEVQVIDQTGRGAGDFDELVLSAGIPFIPTLSDRAVLLQAGSDLELYYNTFNRPEVKIVIEDWFQDDAHKLDAITFRDTTWTPSTVALLLAAQTQPGTAGPDSRVGSADNPVVLGLAGADNLVERIDPALLDGGADSDLILVMDAASFVAGGQGNDRINATSTRSVVSFNRGDGDDTLILSGGGTLSLGGGITIQDVQLTGSLGEDPLGGLTLRLGGADQIRLTIDLLNPPASTLQVVTPSKIELYDLRAAIVDFRNRAAQETEGGSTIWPPSGDWSAYAAGTSLDQAIGGALAYQYGTVGSAGGTSVDSTVAILDSPTFGSGLQSLNLGRSLNEYLLVPGSGSQTLGDVSGIDTVRFGSGITSDMITLGLGSLLLRVGTSGDELHLTDFDPSDVFVHHNIQHFTFSDGTALTYSQLLERGFDLPGTAGDDVTSGTNVTDRIDGKGGNDTLIGGAGSDTYTFGLGSGQDLIREASASVDIDTLQVLANPGDVTVTRETNNLVVSLNGTSDRVAIDWFTDPSARIERVAFADGTIWNAATLEAQAGGQVNHPPVVATPIADQSAIEDSAFSIAVPANTFADPDAGDTLTYSSTLSNGSALPSWLSFNPVTRIFSGTPANGDVGAVSVKVVATDGQGAAAFDVFDLSIANTNDAPVAVADSASVDENGTTANLVPLLLANDTDADAGDTRSIAAVNTTGTIGAVAFNVSTQSLIYSANAAAQDALRAGQTATDNFTYTIADATGAISTATVTMTVTGVNDAPIAVANSVAVNENATTGNLVATLLANDTDVDAGDTRSVTAVNPTGTVGAVAFNAATQSLTYSANAAAQDALRAGQTASDSFTYTIADAAGASSTAAVTVTVTGVNDAPVAVANSVAVNENATTANLVPTLLANDTDVDAGDTRSVTAVNATGTIGAVAFNAATQSLAYTASAASQDALRAGQTASDSFTYTIADAAGATSTATVNVTVTGANDAPVAVANIVSVNENATTVNLVPTLLANDTDVDAGDTRSVTAVNTTGTIGAVAFNAATQSLTYTANAASQEALRAGQTATDSFAYTIADAAGATSTAAVNVTVTGVNDAPVAVANSAAVNENATTANLVATLLANDTDVDAGDTRSITAVNTTGTIGALTFNAATQSLTYSANAASQDALRAGQTATDSFTYTIADAAGASSTAIVTVTVAGVNDAPILVTPVADQNATQNQAFSFQVPGSSFADVDAGDTLTYSASQSDGSALPVWLSFNAAMRTFSGTPLNGDVGTISVQVTATDGASASASDTFDINVANNTNHAPTVAHPVADQLATETEFWSFTVPTDVFADVDAGDALTYSAGLATESALPAWLTFNAETRTFTGTPPDTAAGLLQIRVSGTDGAGASASDDFVLDIANIILGTLDPEYLQGTDFRDVIYGFGGYQPDFNWWDSLDGGLGADILIGSSDIDTYYVDNPGDLIIEDYVSPPLPPQYMWNVDTVVSSITWTLGPNLENLQLTGTASIDGIGNELHNTIIGNSGINTLIGGAGDDTYLVGPGDTVVENPDEGTDTVESSLTYTLGANLENLTLSGSAAINGTGNALNNTLSGDWNPAANVLAGGLGDDTYGVGTGDTVVEATDAGTDTVKSDESWTLGATLENLTLFGSATISGTGNALNNILSGIWNPAANVLAGGLGDDTYVVGTGDKVTEATNAGTDTVMTDISWTLGTNLENLWLMDNLLYPGSNTANGTGNALNNILIGNLAANTLNGGTGADTMMGGGGNDTYVVDNVGDTVTENANEGIDTVQSSITYTLAATVENLTLTGSAAINGTGNALNNVLTGNSAANVLTGGAGNDTLNGGSGADQMTGGVGNDFYVRDNTSDVITENANEGIDSVQSSVTYTLAVNVENLTLTGTSAINGTGNALNNVLTGNSAANALTGGAGNDTYVVGTGDTVTEAANAGTDTVQSSITFTLGTNVENLILTGTTAINGTGNTVANLVRGNTANNTLTGAAGVDVLEGGAGNDTLSDSAGTDSGYLSGGAGTDTLTGGSGREFFLGGTGNDTITTGTGADIIAFNKGDGQDTVNASTGQDNVLSLGGNLNYSDLAFRVVGSDLVLDTGASESLTFKSWYTGTTNKSMLTLQVVAEAMAGFNPAGGNTLLDNKVESFNFQGLVNAFDSARAANPGLSSWVLTNGLAQFQLSGSDTAALGGDLAYQYGLNGTLAGVGFNKAQDVLTGAGFATQAQTLRPLATLQDGFAPLS